MTVLFWFLLFLLPIPAIAILANYKASEGSLGGGNFKRYAVGLSAGATGNTGFIVTGAVGSGYALGLSALLLPLAWFLGDWVFWKFGPRQINSFTKKQKAQSIIDIIVPVSSKKVATQALRLLISIAVTFLLLVYTASQWKAVGATLDPVFQVDPSILVWAGACIVVAYSSIGGFRGSIATDVYQACLMIIITIAALYLVITSVSFEGLSKSLRFSELFDMGLISITLFLLGWAVAAIGFGLAQPHVMSRYMAALNPEEAEGAKWTYLLFLQFTWIGMTLFGIFLAAKFPELGNSGAESGLVKLFTDNDSGFLLGLVLAGVLAAIVSTIDSILVSVAGFYGISERSRVQYIFLILIIGLLSLLIAETIVTSVFTLAVNAITWTASIFAAPVLLRIMHWKCNDLSIFLSICSGILVCVFWKWGLLNVTPVAIVVGLLTNYLTLHFAPMELSKNV